MLGARLLAEPGHAVAESSTATPNGSSGRTTVIVAGAPDSACAARERGEVDVGDPVPVRGVERRPAEPVEHGVDPPAGRGVEPGVDALDGDARRPVGRAANAATSAER